MGVFEAASGGTVFLDEIGNASPQVQARLLRVIQEKMITPLGSTAMIPVDIRIIAATNKDLQHERNFREDLYYRLNVVEIYMPSLRDRGAKDIERLFQVFVSKFSQKHNRIIVNVLNEALFAKLREHDWPGNIREFENMIERAVINARGNVLLTGDFEFPKQRVVNISVNSIADGIIAGEIDWNYVRDSYKGEARKTIILEVCKRLKEKDGQCPTANRLAETFRIEGGNMRRILKGAGISLKTVKKGII